ncbi:MAG: type II toxin-antitoxin system RelE/ParE family toxin [Tannerella sp.]|jgi:plasmid stabilization system protein ParE|nr:type II toxin-antitoxin system RelE/ParE family toxin [Tannerella sp.]
MKKFTIRHTPAALQDLDEIEYYIRNDLGMPGYAERYYNGIAATIKSLRTAGASYAISPIPSVQRRYGPEARTAIYKKYTIIYHIVDDVVWIRRIIAGSLIF